MIRLLFRRYHLPGGSIGRKFVNLLTREVKLVADCKQVSERLIVFQVVLLQRDTAVSKSADVRRLIARRLQLWEDSQFQVLLQETERSDKSLGCLQHVSREWQQADCAHASHVFHRLMIQGKVRAAVR